MSLSAASDPNHFPYPYSLYSLSEQLRHGLPAVAALAILSALSTTALIGFITFRLFAWKRFYKVWVGYNQYVLLIYNLLIADLQQSVSFIISIHWLEQDRILAPTRACFAQGWLIHIGDVASGFFVLAIAVHTLITVMLGRQMSSKWFYIAIASIWAAALFLTAIGPIRHREHFFVRAGAWCWVSGKYESERLWLHYLWIFIAEFGVVVIYAFLFIYLRKRLRSIASVNASPSSGKLGLATFYMIVYPVAYVALTIPLAAGRMASMKSGKNLPDWYYCLAGSFMTSCGWVDALLYTLTRRVLIGMDLRSGKQNTTSNGRSGNQTGWEITSFNGAAAQGRTVTITGGRNARNSTQQKSYNDQTSSLDDKDRGRGFPRRNQHSKHQSLSGRGPSPHGSMDRIMPGWEVVKAETKVEVTIERAEDTDDRSMSSTTTPKRGHSLKRGDGRNDWE